MTQDQVILLLLKIGLVSGFTVILLWVAQYSRLAKWWRNPLGLTIVLEALLIAGLYVPQIVSLFFTMDVFESRIAAWCDVGFIGAVNTVMLQRIILWRRLARTGRLSRNETLAGSSQEKVPAGEDT